MTPPLETIAYTSTAQVYFREPSENNKAICEGLATSIVLGFAAYLALRGTYRTLREAYHKACERGVERNE